MRGTMPTANLVSLLPELDRRGLNVKVVAAISPQLFARQDAGLPRGDASDADRLDAMVITNGAVALMRDWTAARWSRSTRSPPTGTIAGGPVARSRR